MSSPPGRCHAPVLPVDSDDLRMYLSGRASGLIIDTPASFTTPNLGALKGDRTRYGIVRHAIEAFKINVLLVIGNEKLAIEMEKLFSPTGVQVLRGTKSSGVRRCGD